MSGHRDFRNPVDQTVRASIAQEISDRHGETGEDVRHFEPDDFFQRRRRRGG